MAFPLPPCPTQEKEFSYSWVKWLLKVRNIIISVQSSIVPADTTGGGGRARWGGGVDTDEDVIISYPSGLVLQDSTGVYWTVGAGGGLPEVMPSMVGERGPGGLGCGS